MTKVHQLRTYTLATPEAARRYAGEHWGRHLETLPRFGILPLAVWISADDPTQVVALVGYTPGTDPAEADRSYMASADFQADMAGFSMADIVGVMAVTLTPTAASPLQ